MRVCWTFATIGARAPSAQRADGGGATTLRGGLAAFGLILFSAACASAQETGPEPFGEKPVIAHAGPVVTDRHVAEVDSQSEIKAAAEFLPAGGRQPARRH